MVTLFSLSGDRFFSEDFIMSWSENNSNVVEPDQLGVFFNSGVFFDRDWHSIGSHACWLEASVRVTNGTPLGCPLLLPLPSGAHCLWCSMMFSDRTAVDFKSRAY